MSESESLPQPATTEEAPAEPQEPQELPPAEPEVIAKPKRKPRKPKKPTRLEPKCYGLLTYMNSRQASGALRVLKGLIRPGGLHKSFKALQGLESIIIRRRACT